MSVANRRGVWDLTSKVIKLMFKMGNDYVPIQTIFYDSEQIWRAERMRVTYREIKEQLSGEGFESLDVMNDTYYDGSL